MMDLLDAKSWGELEERFPEHTTRDVLVQFTKGLKGVSISEHLRQFTRSITRKANMSMEQESFLAEAPFKGLNKTVGFQLQTNVEDLSANTILQLSPTFLGFDLSVLDLPKVT